MAMLLLVILLHFSGFQQIAEGMQTIKVRSGEDAMLQCPLLDGSNATTANHMVSPSGPSTVSWYRKAAGHAPELLVSFRPADGSNIKYGTAVGPDKVSAAADGSLLLRHSEQSDTAVYYCGISQGSEQKMDPNP
ncbi:secreted immunoglobulin domain 1 [Nothobranchius furzeri]|uniref:secreted immunoglobulin domain 1 n=1 Tax=Nothobranchius furzeri TaxID=105023 RepID=UPI0024041CC3|nr:secreted immunoglobulin domain 1 [Nothobranchius furzeri]